MLHIAVIEINYHAEVLRNTCRILEGLSARVTVYTTAKIWKQANLYHHSLPPNFILALHTPHQASLPAFMNHHRQNINQADVVLFNTLVTHYRFFSKHPFTPPTVIRVHNANTFFLPLARAYRPRFTPFFLWKDFSHFVRKVILARELRYRKKFLQTVSYYAFPNDITKQHAIQTLHVPHTKCITLPFSYLPAKQAVTLTAKKSTDIITITVPGRVDKRTRNYNLLCLAFQQLSHFIAQTPGALQLVLLGNASSLYGKDIIQRLETLAHSFPKKLSIISFTGFVDQKIFQQYMDETDFFVLPINLNTRHTIYHEQYGYTKISGSINDIIVYQKPALIPEGYPIDDALKPITNTFHNADQLAEKIQQWSETRFFEEAPISTALQPYALQIIQQQYQDTLTPLAQP